MVAKLKRAFFSGIFVLLPLFVTAIAATIMAGFLFDHVGEPTRRLLFGHPVFAKHLEGWASPIFNLISILIVVLFVTLFGWLSNYFLGRFFIRTIDRILQRIPIVSAIHSTAKQIVDTFGKDQKAMFRQAVLVQFPRKDMYSIGFLTNRAQGEIQYRTQAEVVNVFVPTTPNPTSGFLVMVPQEEVIFLEMSVGDAMKTIVSGGVLVPSFQTAPEKHPS
jgi:uncharacterized membrane protein